MTFSRFSSTEVTQRIFIKRIFGTSLQSNSSFLQILIKSHIQFSSTTYKNLKDYNLVVNYWKGYR